MTTAQRCTLCRNLVDPEDLFCGNCGREVESSEAGPKPGLEQGLVGFDCRGCGASMTYDAHAQALHCAFCGSTDLARQAQPAGRIEPHQLVPFVISRDEAIRAFRTWLGKGFWRPSGLAQQARLVAMQAVFVPCWRFTATTDTHWTADTSQTPAFASAAWCPVGGHSAGVVDDLLVVASGALTPTEVAGLEPFDLATAAPYARETVGDVPVEDVGLSRRGARPLALRRIAEEESARCAALVPAKSRNVHVDPLVTDLTSDVVLLPVWINAYRWKKRSFRFLVNGQTGTVIGQAPRSFWKPVILVAIAGAMIALLFARGCH